MSRTHRAVSLLLGAAGLPLSLHAQTTYNETEPNDNKLQANGPLVMASGDRIVGNSISASGAGLDYFIVKTASAPAGIYKHRLTVTTTGATGHTATIQGRDRLGGLLIPSTDITIQTSSASTSPARHVAWYGFGRQERVVVRINGGAATTADYTATLDSAPVSVTNLGTFPGGAMTITSLGQGHTTNTEVWVYSSALAPIAGYGNDDEPAPGTTTHAKLTRDFSTPGLYYLAISTSNLASDLDSPSDDRNTTSDVLDYPDALADSSATTAQNISFVITDGSGVDHPVAAIKDGPFDVVWFSFTTTAPAVTGVCCMPTFETCFVASQAGCAANGGTYAGNGTICANTDCPLPGACCFGSDFTCRFLGTAPCTAAGGVFQGVGSTCGNCPHPPAGSVAIVAAANGSNGGQIDGNSTDVQAKLTGTGLFPSVVIFNANRGAPTLEYLQQFKAVLTWTNANYFDAVATGNVLADYVDAGGGVVVATFANSSATAYRWLLGRWEHTYEIIPTQGGSTSGAATLGTIVIPGHPIMDGVASIAGGSTNQRPTTTSFTPHGLKVAEWSTGKTLVAVSSQYPRRVDLGLYPPSTDTNSTGWTATTDGARLMANALLYAGRALSTCYPNCDASTATPFLNVADFTCFLQKFAAADPYANCDASTQAPVLNVVDFTCFLTKFAAGCSAP